ncbi:hypothetical protein CTAYLR_004500 [Chrysophaeum taylorii]|uniref:BTB domain-containing protein n=1 Tax=Chrysophaeum taylorii TaxID=2483200 RepID=A0AAD7XIW0_9STRA|nr:hypothetical protein CTAYLR_004500 [Chrysophaeum taylorii]
MAALASHLGQAKTEGMFSDVEVVAEGFGWEARQAAHRVVLAQADYFRARLERWSGDVVGAHFDDRAATRGGFEDVLEWLYTATWPPQDRWVARLSVASFIAARRAVDECAAALARPPPVGPREALRRALEARDAARTYDLPGLGVAAGCLMRTSIALAVLLGAQISEFLGRVSSEEMKKLLGIDTTFHAEAWFPNEQSRKRVVDAWVAANRAPLAAPRPDALRFGFAFDASKLATLDRGDWLEESVHESHLSDTPLGCYEHFVPELRRETALRLRLCNGHITANFVVHRDNRPLRANLHLALRFFKLDGATVFLDPNLKFHHVYYDSSSHYIPRGLFKHHVSSDLTCFPRTHLPNYHHFGRLFVALTLTMHLN